MFLTLVVPALLLASGACGRPGEPVESAAPSPVSARTETASFEQVAQTVRTMGSVEPSVRVSPGTKILGRIERVEVEIGRRVARGQLLAALEMRDLQAAVEQARAAVAMAEAQLDNSRAQYARMQELHRRGSVTDKNLEDATSGFRVAEAALQQAQANLSAAEVTLDYAEIRSPIAGWVTAKRIEAGDMARPGEPLFVVEDLSRVEVVVSVPESQVAAIAPGDPARVILGVPETTRDAVVDSVNPSGDPTSRTFEVRLLLDNPDGRLKAGMFARAEFEHGSRSGLFVSTDALVERGALRGLFVVDAEGRGRLRWIRTGKTLDDRVEVLSGLQAGERYVVAPPLSFADGTPVREG
jgi:RND family efflux transporter MFP subunit